MINFLIVLFLFSVAISVSSLPQDGMPCGVIIVLTGTAPQMQRVPSISFYVFCPLYLNRSCKCGGFRFEYGIVSLARTAADHLALRIKLSITFSDMFPVNERGIVPVSRKSFVIVMVTRIASFLFIPATKLITGALYFVNTA